MIIMSKATSLNITQIGLIVTDQPTSTEYEGSREDLIGDGICSAEQFPEGRKRLKYGGKGNDFWSMRRIKGERFVFSKSHEYRPARPKREAYFESPEVWQEHRQRYAVELLAIVDELVSGKAERDIYGETTICLDQDTLQEIRAAINQIETSLRCGNAVWTGTAKWAKRKLPAAKKDRIFQAFLGGLTK